MKRIAFLSLVFLVVPPGFSQNFDSLRFAMVRHQIVARGITHKPTLDAMRKVKRHLFVPNDIRHEAYEDRPLPIGYGQTISQPLIVAYMTSLVDPRPESRVLEIGTGSGYQAAILAEIVKKVVTMEIVPELGREAKERLKKMSYDNIEVIIADGYNGMPAEGPFDAIVVTAAAEHIPPPLIEQLKEGGKMIIPVGSPFMVQNLILAEKRNGKIVTTSLMTVRFVPFKRK